MTIRPTTREEVVDALKAHPSFRVVGTNSQRAWRVPGLDRPTLALDALTGIVRHDVADQVVVVRPGTVLSDLQSELATYGQTLPLAPVDTCGTVGGAISMNLPHRLEGAYGSWRDWLLGLQAVTADGETVRAGSQVVKNVAGYDVHKLFVGARGTLGVIVEATLRTYPLAGVPASATVQIGGPFEPAAIQRVRRTDFSAAVEVYSTGEGDATMGTLWLPESETVRRFPDDWVLRQGTFETDALTQRLMLRTKQLFDSSCRLNPGEFGF